MMMINFYHIIWFSPFQDEDVEAREEMRMMAEFFSSADAEIEERMIPLA